MTEITKIEQGVIVDYVVKQENKKVLTHYQKCIYKDLCDAVKEKRPITRESIIRLFLHSKYPKSTKANLFVEEYTIYRPIYKKVNNSYTLEEMENRSEIKAKAVAWYKTNLGSVIVKGKLIILPIIDVE